MPYLYSRLSKAYSRSLVKSNFQSFVTNRFHEEFATTAVKTDFPINFLVYLLKF